MIGSLRAPRVIAELVRLAVTLAIVLAIGAVYQARGDNHDTTYWACLYAGSLSQVGTTQPANCGRGAPVSWTSGGQPGVSQAYHSNGAHPTLTLVYGAGVNAPSTTTLRSLDVPAGTYIVSATVALFNATATTRDVVCFVDGETRVQLAAEVGSNDDAPDTVVIPLETSVELSQPGSIVLGCYVFDEGLGGQPSQIQVGSSALTALPVSQLN